MMLQSTDGLGFVSCSSLPLDFQGSPCILVLDRGTDASHLLTVNLVGRRVEGAYKSHL